MPNSALVQAIKKFVIRTFWPWFIKNVWPLIVKHILATIAAEVRNLSASITSDIRARMNARAENAESHAQAAVGAAHAAATEAERIRQEAIAKVWRQIAEEFRAENESLRAKVAQLTDNAQGSLTKEVQGGKPSLSDLDGSPSLAIGQRHFRLPALPYKDGEP